MDIPTLPLSDTWVVRVHTRPCVPGGVAVRNTYAETYNSLVEFDTVQRMWQTLNNLPFVPTVGNANRQMRVEGVSDGAIGVSVFRKGTLPTWEAFTQEHDGALEMKVQSVTPERLQRFWETLVMDVAGGGELAGRDIDVGCVVGVRFIDKTFRGQMLVKFEVWISGTDAENVQRIVSWARDLCNEQDITATTEFVPHALKVQGIASNQPPRHPKRSPVKNPPRRSRRKGRARSPSGWPTRRRGDASEK